MPAGERGSWQRLVLRWHPWLYALTAARPSTPAPASAALWLAAKLCGVRTSIPNRSLLSQATRVDAQALSDFELDLLFSLDWDAAGVLARQGLLC